MSHPDTLGEAAPMTILGLPNEILIEISANLSVPDFLNLTSTNKSFHNLRNEHTFWRRRAQGDFRVPEQPLLETDGARWHWLYKALHTQSEVFTWGDNKNDNLGRDHHTESDLEAGYPRSMSGVFGPRGIGKIVDVQCGGWSTVLMNSHGKLFAAGVINGELLRSQRLESNSLVVPVTMPLRPQRKWILDISHRTLNQFSMGRKRLLALSDQGEVIEWTTSFTVAGEVLSADHLDPDVDYAAEPIATQVVAGWAHGSALYPGHGLYYWSSAPQRTSTREPRNRILSEAQGSGSIRVPGTTSGKDIVKDSLEERMGSVKKYIVLEHHILILTQSDKLFSWRTTNRPRAEGGGIDIDNYEPTELASFYSRSAAKVLDIQGSFRNFGVFMSNDTILIGRLSEEDLLNTPRFLDKFGEKILVQLPEPEINPALQNARVTQLAFGDFHYHALHYNGEVTSYGSELDACGALGFGRQRLSILRGVSFDNGSRGDLQVHPQSDGHRRVWFEPEKFMFLCVMLDKFIATLREDDTLRYAWETKARDFRNTYSEWLEQEGRDWSSGPSANKINPGEQPQQPAFFPIKITAAGWSSAAVVLVDQARAAQDREQYLLPKHRKEKEVVAEDQASFTDWIKNLSQRLQTMNFAGVVGGWLEGTSCTEAEKYIWSEMEFPRLRLPDDDSLIVDKEATAWKYGEPSWLQPSTADS